MKKVRTFTAALLTMLILIQSVAFTNVFATENNNYDKMVSIANQEVGYLETTYSDGTFSSKYGEWYGIPNGAWCAMFVSWCANEAGISTTAIPKFASCHVGMQWFKEKQLWKEKTEYTPVPGDLIFLNDCTHVGIVEKYDDGIIYTIEGNACDENNENYGVRKRFYSATSSKITGYGLPDKAVENKINGKALCDKTAYMLPDTTSQTVWEIWKDDDLEILCKDGDFYLVMYPFLNSSKFVCAYVPETSVTAYAEIPDSNEYYSINSNAVVINANTTLYHNPSDSSLLSNTGVDKKIRATVDANTNCQVLFEKDGYYFIKTDSGVTGFAKCSDIELLNEIETTQNTTTPSSKLGDVDGDGSVNIKDATNTQGYVAHLVSEKDINIISANVDADSGITIKDATLIQEYVAHLIDLFPGDVVTPTVPEKIEVESIKLPESIQITIGDTVPVLYQISPDNATDKSVFWMSADENIATVSDDGVITANSIGSTKIFAVTTNGIRGTVTVTIINKYVPVESITINNPNTAPVYTGTNIQLSASVFPENATDKGITWTSSNPDVASVDANGYVTTKSAGTVTITATNSTQEIYSRTIVKVNQLLSYIPDDTYCFKLKNTNSYLDHQGGNTNGTNVLLWSGDGYSNPNQKINLQRIDDNRHKLWSAVSTNLMIDVNRGSSYSDPLKIGLNVDLWENNDWEAQEWLFTKTYDGYYIIRLNMLQEGALEASGTADGSNIFYGTFDCENDMQKWEIISTIGYTVPETTAWIYNTQDIGNVHVRSGPGQSYASIGGFNEGQQITVIGNTNETWLKVRGANRHNGETIEGYTHRDYIKFVNDTPQERAAWIYNTQDIGNVNVRSGPGTNYASIGGFNEGQQITVIGELNGDWYKVKGTDRHTGNTIDGYTHKDYITFTEPSSPGGTFSLMSPVPAGTCTITCPYGGYAGHVGTDLGSYDHKRVDIYASESGTVIGASNSCTHNYGKEGSCGCNFGMGNYVKIDHGNGYVTIYMHLTSADVSVGQYVSKGQKIGVMGSTGNSSGTHLHFQLRINGVDVNPQNYVQLP